MRVIRAGGDRRPPAVPDREEAALKSPHLIGSQVLRHIPHLCPPGLLTHENVRLSFWKTGCTIIASEGVPMFRFDKLIRRDMIVRDVKQQYPKTIAVFEQFRFHPVCDDCDIGTVARKNGLEIPTLIDALNAAAFGLQPEKGNHGSYQ